MPFEGSVNHIMVLVWAHTWSYVGFLHMWVQKGKEKDGSPCDNVGPVNSHWIEIWLCLQSCCYKYWWS